MTGGAQAYRSIAELARRPTSNSAFHRIFRVDAFHPDCHISVPLSEKYGFESQHVVQHVVAVSNRVTHDLCWWNPVRSSKPQNFNDRASAPVDPTGGGSGCDFCDWAQMTAEDSFGRLEGPFAITASNLFKYVAPSQGVVMFKHHEPLDFSLPQLADLLTVASRWFDAAARQAARDSASELHPLLVWNSGARAGASFYHGHVQTMLSARPFPALQREAALQRLYENGNQYCYYSDVLAAHEAVGLARHCTSAAGASAAAYAALCPWKDFEVVVQGDALTCPAFQHLLHVALRTLIDDLGVRTFNASIHNIPFGASDDRSTPAGSSSGGGGSNGSVPRPVVARVASRGRPTAMASDFGGLEVFGGASIGHTDPFRVAEALGVALARCSASQR